MEWWREGGREAGIAVVRRSMLRKYRILGQRGRILKEIVCVCVCACICVTQKCFEYSAVLQRQADLNGLPG